MAAAAWPRPVAVARRGAFGASLALHGAIAGAAVLPFLRPEPIRPAAPPVMEVVWISQAAPAAAMAEAAPEPVEPFPEPEPLAEPPTVERLPEPEPEPGPPPAPRPQAARAAPPRPAPRAEAPRRPAPRPDHPRTPAGMAEEASSAAATLPPAAPAAPAGPILVTAPRYRLPPIPPAYPPRAVELGLTGTATIRARVSPAGETEEVRVWRSSGQPLLDAAALAAVRRWAFAPASLDGRPVEAWVEVPVHFRLN